MTSRHAGKRRRPVVGLLGAVASGKSTVARLMAAEGADVIDADRLGHAVLERPEVKQHIRSEFGPGVFEPDGRVSRQRLGETVFGSPDRREKLNRMVHPIILELIEGQLRELHQRGGRRVVVLDAALLLETGLHRRHCDLLVFVEAPLAVREARVQHSHGWSAERLAQRDAAQVASDVKKSHADFVIDNSGTLQELEGRVRAVMEQITKEHSLSSH